ncbi:MAG: PDZ domain-containing protein [Gemmatimonadota bacterium]
MKRLVLSMCLVGLASGVSAQERHPPTTGVLSPSRERTIVTTGPEGSFSYFKLRRGIIGITVRIMPSTSDSVGALVEAVTPSGPAFKAGIRSGDIITNFNGTSLSAAAQEAGKSSPGLVLVETSASLDAGDTAMVELRRGRERRTVSLVLENGPPLMPLMERTPFEGPTELGATMHTWEGSLGAQSGTLSAGGPEGTMFFRTRSDLDFELAPMNSGLGQYFGVSEGVLVVSVPDGSRLNLKAGDVVTAIDGRKVSNPNLFFRILRSYDPVDTLTITLVRMKKRETILGRLESR